MPGWLTWLLVGLLVWVLVSIPVTLYLGRMSGCPRAAIRRPKPRLPRPSVQSRHRSSSAAPVGAAADPDRRRRRRPPDAVAHDARRGRLRGRRGRGRPRASELARFWRPTVVLLDVAMPGIDGLSFSGEPQAQAGLRRPGRDPADGYRAHEGGRRARRRRRAPPEALQPARARDRDRPHDGHRPRRPDKPPGEAGSEQLLLYARDLGRLVEIERMQQRSSRTHTARR